MTRSARDGCVGAGTFAALTSISTRMGRLSILTLSRAAVALTAWSALLKMTMALPRLRPDGPYCIKIRLGFPTPIAEMKYSYKAH